MRYLGIGDYSIILAYFAILIGIGSYFRKKAAAMSTFNAIVKQFRASAVAASILSASLVGLYFFWHKKLPPA